MEEEFLLHSSSGTFIKKKTYIKDLRIKFKNDVYVFIFKL